MAPNLQMKALIRISADLETLDDAGLRYVIDRAQARLALSFRPGPLVPSISAVTHPTTGVKP